MAERILKLAERAPLPPVDDIVKECKELLEMAENGRLRGLAYIAFDGFGCTDPAVYIAGEFDSLVVIGASHRLVTLIDELDEE